MVNPEVQRLVADMKSGKIRALSRAISWVESQTKESSELLEKVYACAKAPWVIGITGVGGAGKSSLVPHIAKYFANQGRRVAVLAVDPSSPITGGALLGDRIRDNGGQQHPHIFFRSVASRGGQGGLATCVSDLTRVVSTAGFDVVLIETVGAGQSELAILNVAHTIMLIHAPGLGDDIQAQKAGVMEIADVLVVNKADKPGAQDAVLMLQQALLLSEKNAHMHEGLNLTTNHPAHWHPPVVSTIAIEGKGIEQTCQQLQAHFAYLQLDEGYEKRNHAHVMKRMHDYIKQLVLDRLAHQIQTPSVQIRMEKELTSVTHDPLGTARELADSFFQSQATHSEFSQLLRQSSQKETAP